MRSSLLDTGVLVALLDRSDRSHEVCKRCFTALEGELLTTEPVLTETVYLLGPAVHVQRAAIEFVLQGGARLVPQSEASLRRAVAYMPQEPQIFNVAVSEHIRYGRDDATDEDVQRAAEMAQASGFIEALPEGYDTLVGEQGALLSGGQRQRLDLARALIGAAPILVLDEPTSNLDAESERLFLDALQRVRARGDTTLIVIAHHLSTVVLADLIYVIEDGRVRAHGTHDELMRQDDWYQSAFGTQQPTSAAAYRPSVETVMEQI